MRDRDRLPAAYDAPPERRSGRAYHRRRDRWRREVRLAAVEQKSQTPRRYRLPCWRSQHGPAASSLLLLLAAPAAVGRYPDNSDSRAHQPSWLWEQVGAEAPDAWPAKRSQ